MTCDRNHCSQPGANRWSSHTTLPWTHSDGGRSNRLFERKIRAVITSTSLELGVDIGTADLTIQIGSPGGVARCLQRVGRAGHRRGAQSRGLLLAATPAELAGVAITARAARAGRVEPLGMVRAPLDVALPAVDRHGLRWRPMRQTRPSD